MSNAVSFILVVLRPSAIAGESTQIEKLRMALRLGSSPEFCQCKEGNASITLLCFHVGEECQNLPRHGSHVSLIGHVADAAVVTGLVTLSLVE